MMPKKESHYPQYIIFMADDSNSPLFWNDKGEGIGDVESVCIGDEVYSLSSLKGLKEWFLKANKYNSFTESEQFTTEGMDDWIKQGNEFALQIRDMIPCDIVLYYCHVEKCGDDVHVMKRVILTEKNKEKQQYALFKQITEKYEREQREETERRLKKAAFRLLLKYPGADLGTWAFRLCLQNGEELVGVFGSNPTKINDSLIELWRSPYYDEESGIEYTYKQWAEQLAGGQKWYYDIVNKKKT